MSQISTSDTLQTDRPAKVDLAVIARDQKLNPEHVEKTVQLLDDGNTIPFITRFRKDLTGGLNEKQILAIKQQVTRLRALAERRAFILKSIESHGKLTDELRADILKASSSRRLEDLYLPFKPKKQNRAATARQQGLEPLAEDILNATGTESDLAKRATDFVRVDKGLKSVDDVIRGVSDLLVERFGERGELRNALRQVIWDTGSLVAQTTESAPPSASREKSDKPAKETSAPDSQSRSVHEANEKSETKPQSHPDKNTQQSGAAPDAMKSEIHSKGNSGAPDQTLSASIPKADSPPKDSAEAPASEVGVAGTSDAPANSSNAIETGAVQSAEDAQSTALDSGPAPGPEPDRDGTKPSAETVAAAESVTPQQPAINAGQSAAEDAANDTASKANQDESASQPKKKKKKKKKKSTVDPFKDYHDFKQSLKNIPHHRVLAINRGERAGKLKVKVAADDKKIAALAHQQLVPDDHPFQEFLGKCANESVAKVIYPSLEREVRRELTEAAERHAVDVFANNLRNLLLQPPNRNRCVLAIDPGFKRGCSVAVLDKFGNVIDSGHVFVVGSQTRREESKQKLVEWITSHSVDLVAIGNGAACRQAEQLVSDVLTESFQDHKVRYVMVNEAGASAYSTSETAREELPDLSPSIRSAASIGRRLQDPLSELVKISPANIGVGMYQHDVKAKHLSDSLDEVVAFCVNKVGVNANTASPSLLKYVSGLNALTARRLVEYRQQINGFKSRKQLKEVNGIGDATFVQAAGFLKIRGGENPLDATSIHPESYEIASDIIRRVDSTPEELFPSRPDPVVNSVTPTAQTGAKPAESDQSDSTAAAPDGDAGQPGSAAHAGKQDAEQNQDSEQLPAAPLKAADPAVPANIEQASPTIEPAPVVQPPEANETSQNKTGSSKEGKTESSISKDGTVPATDESAQGHVPVPATQADSTDDDGVSPERRKEIVDRISRLDFDEIAKANSAGKLQVQDIILTFKNPDWDPRDKVKRPIFRKGIIKVDDLEPGMSLDGQIVNVVDFGVFVDIGLGESSLVHVSQLSHQYVRDPHRFCAVGDVLKVWVSEVDSQRRRVKLTAIRPGSRSTESRRGGGRKPSRKSGERPRRGPRKSDSRPRSQHQRKERGRRRPPQPVTPITDGMLKGDEPMRSFSDLAQFVKNKPSSGDSKSDDSKSGDSKSGDSKNTDRKKK